MGVLVDALEFYRSCLDRNPRAKQYLEKRGISKKVWESFGLGYAPVSGFEKWAERKGYTEKELEEAGLYKKNGKYKKVFYNAIVIPIYDEKGSIVSVTTRNMSNKKGIPKYINLPDTPITNFFGIDKFNDRYKYKHSNKNYIVLCEGQFDTMLLHANGIFSLGIMGVHNIREPMFKYLEMFDTIILCFDNDGAGRKAGNQMAEYIRYYNRQAKIFRVDFEKNINDVSDIFTKHRNADIENYVLSRLEEVIVRNPKKFIKKQPKKRKQSFQDANERQLNELLKEINPCIKMSITGNNVKCLCPFDDHEDTVGSFTIYLDTNTYYCFGCGRGGGFISFLMNYYHKSFKEIKEILEG